MRKINVGTRLKQSTYEVVKKLAEESEETISEYIRKVIERHCHIRG